MANVDDVEMVDVISSNIAAIGFSEEDNTLFVEFTRGGIYSYSGVPKEEFDNLRDAGSVGGYFASNIKRAYRGTKV